MKPNSETAYVCNTRACLMTKKKTRRSRPYRSVREFTVGSRDVMPGISLGVVGMAPGEQKRFTLQPIDAYGP